MMIKIERKDCTKKEWREMQKARRSVNGFNTGTRVFKDKKHPDRNSLKKDLKKCLTFC